MAGDLHSHTNFSDGSADIERLPAWARRAGLTHLAISDHDSLRSVRYAQEHPTVDGVTLLPATELSCCDAKTGRRVHVLCFCPEVTPALAAFCESMARRRNETTHRSMAELEALYPLFSREAALAYAKRSGVTFKTHLMRELCECGYADSIYGELYRKLFGIPGGLVLHEPEYEEVHRALAIVRDAHGVAVLAHPSVYQSMALAQELAAQGLIDGVEIDHPRNTPQDQQTLRALARQYDLIVTGGTDFHGMHSAHPLPLGTCTTDDANIERILRLAAQRRAQAAK